MRRMMEATMRMMIRILGLIVLNYSPFLCYELFFHEKGAGTIFSTIRSSQV